MAKKAIEIIAEKRLRRYKAEVVALWFLVAIATITANLNGNEATKQITADYGVT